MSISIENLEIKWKMIAKQSGFLGLDIDHPLSFHIGYKSESEKSFIVLNTGLVEDIASSKAVQVDNYETSQGKYSLQFTLNYPSLEELFVRLCWDLLDASNTSHNPVDSLVKRYKSWIKLLQADSPNIMSPSVQKGLLGELIYLEQLVCETSDIYSVESWLGPDGADQDFIFEESWTEVKAVGSAANSVKISSIQQLDNSKDGTLLVISMDKTTKLDTTGISLPEKINDIRSKMLHQEIGDLFSTKLAKQGYQDRDALHYSEIKYKIHDKRSYQVNSLFPKLTKSNIPIEISNVTYLINLASIELWRVK